MTNASPLTTLEASSFLRPGLVRYNSVLKSRDFGILRNLSAHVSGSIGSQSGSATLFFKVQTIATARLGIQKLGAITAASRQISVGISDSALNPLPLDEQGFAQRTLAYSTHASERASDLPAGVYYFSISSSRWQTSAFEIGLLVISDIELSGALIGSLEAQLGFQRNLLQGVAGGTAEPSGSLRPVAQIKTLSGVAGGGIDLLSTAAIPGGVASGTLEMTGRLKATILLDGVAGGELIAEVGIRNYSFSGVALLLSLSAATIRKRRASGYDY